MTDERQLSAQDQGARPRRPVTLDDVAKEARVAKSTVSRALNNPGRLNPDTQDHVRRVAERLGYRALSTPRRNVVLAQPLALIVPGLTNPYFLALLRGAEHGAAATGRSLLVIDSQDDGRREATQVERLAGSVSGFISASSRLPTARLRDLAQLHRLVLVNRQMPGVASVVIDPVAGPVAALQHLASLGHREVAYLAATGGRWTDLKRWNAIRGAADVAGTAVRRLGPFQAATESGPAAADALVSDGATAAIAFNDLLAIGILHRLRERGLSVPGDISVVGFDDVFGASFCSPPLTTVAAPLEHLGRAAVSLLVEHEEPGWTPRSLVLPAHLVVRDSTAAALSARAPIGAG